MRVAIIYKDKNIGGSADISAIEDSLTKLVRTLNQNGHTANLFSMEPGESASHPEIDSSDAFISFKEIDYLSEFFSQANEYDLINVHGSLAPAFFARITETPVLLTLDPSSVPYRSGIQRICNDRIYFAWTSDQNPPECPNSLGVIHYDSPGFADDCLGAYNRIILSHHREDHRPWGYYQVLSDLDDHKVKRIVVYPGKRLSLQRHAKRSEHWVIVSGEPIVTLDSQQIAVGAGQSIDIPLGVKHRIQNPGSEPVVFVEIQMGSYFGEDDIERFEDDFGRA